MVGSILCFSVVAKINTACLGGSSNVLRNALIPVITYTVVNLPFLILGSLLLESFFSIPGLGGMILNALNSSDFPVLKAMGVLSAISYILFTLISDILYTMVDPRVKLQ